MEQTFPLAQSLVAMAAISMLPVIAVIATSFTKISVVLLIVRNAIGIQQTPPNLLVFAIAIVLSAFVMNPVLQNSWQLLLAHSGDFATVSGMADGMVKVAAPLKDFMLKFSDAEVRDFFVQASQKIWANAPVSPIASDDITVLTPSFLVSELTRAFEIGFLIYLPFLMIDFAVSAILVALGMQMMSPTVVSTPLKLLLFVSIDGWRRLLEGLVLSYAQ
ncbi:type III secretion system export apparatus subunit SctR [Rhizobium sp. MC63]|uniref:Type III secretion protein R n=5 Tax=Rhizobium TaxID=379 RepID=A0A1C3Y9U5_9HYPH|nr:MULTISPECIES: type III secretion system export apparatus subunit SctR [Rhizobium]ANK88331.1 type III secretion system FliP/YscR family protein [Rhizobium sp. N731]ANL18579.1 type III secretion system FliP/YscR family protein [Rhizobium sp. N1314]ANL37165.1 type III secretion system FliP/YscR family protein [Rhizobium phaseoli]ANL43543.1 type III secretion system FliP/YscR family protein [Rhizobium phaseoli]ANL49794.1 type III secretion system FliP/YscR family protein [Rhizobium phaseoli]